MCLMWTASRPPGSLPTSLASSTEGSALRKFLARPMASADHMLLPELGTIPYRHTYSSTARLVQFSIGLLQISTQKSFVYY